MQKNIDIETIGSAFCEDLRETHVSSYPVCGPDNHADASVQVDNSTSVCAPRIHIHFLMNILRGSIFSRSKDSMNYFIYVSTQQATFYPNIWRFEN